MCQGRADGHLVPSGRVVGMKPGHDVQVWLHAHCPTSLPLLPSPRSEREHGGGQGRSVDEDGNVEATRGAGQVTTAVTVRREGACGPAGTRGRVERWRTGTATPGGLATACEGAGDIHVAKERGPRDGGGGAEGSRF